MMAEKWPDATIYGVDSSPQMIEKASATPSRVQWAEADVRTWQPAKPPDLIYSNAALQWVDGHKELFPQAGEPAGAGRLPGRAGAPLLADALAPRDAPGAGGRRPRRHAPRHARS